MAWGEGEGGGAGALISNKRARVREGGRNFPRIARARVRCLAYHCHFELSYGINKMPI